MATTRDFKSLGVWAENAETVIPVEPITSTAYRDESVTEADNEAGEGFDTIPNSATFNQRLFIVSSFTDLMDTHGIVGWSDDVDYDIPAMVFADNGLFYFALQPSGPSTAPQDPTGAPTFWEEFVTQQLLAADTGASLIGTARTGFTLAGFVPHAWAAVVRPDGTISDGATRGFTPPVSHPSTGVYTFTLSTPTSTINNRMVLVSPLVDIVGGDGFFSVGQNLNLSTLSTVAIETFSDPAMLEDPGPNSGFSIIIYNLEP